MYRHEAYPGQIVYVAGKLRALGKVFKTNPKNLKVTMQDGTKWNIPYTFARPATQEEIDTYDETTPAGPSLCVGMLVRFKNEKHHAEHGVQVVIGQYGVSWRLAPLGGNGGSYLRGISEDELQVIDFNVETVE